MKPTHTDRPGATLGRLVAPLVGVAIAALITPAAADPPPEVRGTWLTTTANTHLASPADTARTMAELRRIGLNTVYVESWKNGYTQFPSVALERVIGVDRRPNLMRQDPSDREPTPPRDLLQEAVIEAHRNQLLCIAWFEYGFMAAHEGTQNHLRERYPHWLSRDRDGGEVAPNGFVWMNPLHPRPRRLLTDIVLEAIDRYDLDGVQLDDRIVWPYVTMGYDQYTVDLYRNEHGGAEPPDDPREPEWMRWRADKINEYARQFVAEIRQRRPGLIVSLSPAPYPWCWEHYLLEWPEWAAWRPGNRQRVWWDEFIPQCYRYDFDAFRVTWDQQIQNLEDAGAARRTRSLLAGVLTTGSRPDPVPWNDLSRSIEHVRSTGGGGHVWWFSRGVLDEYPTQIAALYDADRDGHAARPDRPPDWRPAPVALSQAENGRWAASARVEPAHYRLIVRRAGEWTVDRLLEPADIRAATSRGTFSIMIQDAENAELLTDRRPEMRRARR